MPGGGDSDRVGALPRACPLLSRGPGDPAPLDLSVLMLLKIEGVYGLGFRVWAFTGLVSKRLWKWDPGSISASRGVDKFQI